MKNLFANAQNTFPLAVLIDADNAHPKIIPGLIAAIARLGNASVKRIYGDWTTPNLAHWKSILLEHSIQPVQQFAYTSGKNATDSVIYRAFPGILSGVERQRLHPAGSKNQGIRQAGLWFRRRENATAICRGLRRVYLYRGV
jgi:hypothetical protein